MSVEKSDCDTKATSVDALPSSGRRGIPLPAEFYQSLELPPIIESTNKLQGISAAIYTVCAAVFVFLMYRGATTVQEVKVTVIVPITTGLDDGFVCKSLTRYSGNPFKCQWDGIRDMKTRLCNPPRKPVNCDTGKYSCAADAGVLEYDRLFSNGWQISMENVYFTSYTDCVSKMSSIVNDTLNAPPRYSNGFLTWPYNGSISIGDRSAKFVVTMTAPVCRTDLMSYDRPVMVPLMWDTPGIPTCLIDNSSFYVGCALIPDSAADLWTKSLTSEVMLSSDNVGGPNCARPTPETLCQPFQTLGPYSCVKTTEITQPILQVLGSSLSNATTLLTVLTMAFAWILKKFNQPKAPKSNAAAIIPSK